MKLRYLTRSTAVCAAIVAVVLYLRTLPQPTTQAGADVTNAHSPAAPTVRVPEVPASLDSPAKSAPGVSASRLTLDEFRHATDYLDLANSLLTRAQDGDPDAQYYLYAALQYCDDSYRMFFRKRGGGGTRTLDEALNRVSTRPAERTEVVRLAYERCARMFDGGGRGLGSASEWLKLATKNEQPTALVMTAKNMLLDPPPGIEPDAAARSAEAMLSNAVRKGDPDAMWRIGELQPLLGDDNGQHMLRQWAWMLAACQRGYDCENSSWMEFSCRFDQLCAEDKNAVDFIRRTTGLDFPEIESRAKAINANIDSGAWGLLERDLRN